MTIEGVEELHPVTHRVVGDRIEAGTFIVAGALMADDRGVDVTGFCPIHLGMVLKKMELMGIDCERVEDGVHVNRAERIKPVDIQTLPFPGFPTDMQAQIMVLSALADGSSVITENIFENRFMFASELVRMGADIRIESHHAMIHGVKGFSGAQVTSPDLRGGAALVVAGLIADRDDRGFGHPSHQARLRAVCRKAAGARRACRACFRPRSRHLLIQVAHV